MKSFNNFLFNEADPETDGGASGLGADPAPAADPTPPSQDPEDTNNLVGPDWMKEWDVDEDLRQDPALKAIQNKEALVKSYIHSQRKTKLQKTHNDSTNKI